MSKTSYKDVENGVVFTAVEFSEMNEVAALNPLTAKIFNLNFHSLELVSR